jgi:hypothetical protein
MEAHEENVDNMILQPYLDQWQDRADSIYDKCFARHEGKDGYGFPTMSPTISMSPSISIQPSLEPTSSPSSQPTMSAQPSAAPTCARTTNRLDTFYSNGNRVQVERTNGIFFDIENTSMESDIAIKGLDVHVAERDGDNNRALVRVFVKAGSWQEGDAATNETAWTEIGTPGEGIQVRPRGKYDAATSLLDLTGDGNGDSGDGDHPILVPASETLGVYIVQMEYPDLYSTYHGADGKDGRSVPLNIGDNSSQDGPIVIKAGSAVTLGAHLDDDGTELPPLPFSATQNIMGGRNGRMGAVGFNGHIDYVIDPCGETVEAAKTRGIFTTEAPTVSSSPSISSSPSSVPTFVTDSPTSSPMCTQSYGSTDTLYPDKSTQIERSNGILFDIENKSDEEIAITSLDINMRHSTSSTTTTVGPQKVELYVRPGSWQENDGIAVNDSDMWTQISPATGFLVWGAGKFNPTQVDLMEQGKESIRIAPGSTMGVYVVQTDTVDSASADMYSVYHGTDAKDASFAKQVGATAATSDDGLLELKVGQARSLDSQEAFHSGNTFGGASAQGPVSFNGHIGYIVSPCNDDGDGDGEGTERRSLKSSGSGQKLRGSPTNNDQQQVKDAQSQPQSQAQNQPQNTERLLDHNYIDGWYDGTSKNPAEFSKPGLFWDPFRLWTSPWYIRYRGSFTMPQCFDDTRVRVLDRWLQISQRQKNQMDQLIANMRDRDTCKLATVGKPRNDGMNSKLVDVNRPLQTTTSAHGMHHCSSRDWHQNEFFRTPRGNTCWCLLTGECPEGCGTDCAGNCKKNNTQTDGARLFCDEHYAPKQDKWNVYKCTANDIYGD